MAVLWNPSRPLAGSRNSVVCLGDSQVANNQDVSTADRLWNTSLGWMGWFQQRTNQTLDWRGNFGYAGSQIPIILSSGLSSALALNPGWMFINGGGNDLNSGAQPVATVKERIGGFIEAVISQGINAVWIMLPPSTSGTLAQANSNHEINGWIKSKASQMRGLIVCDMARYCSDVNGYMSASYSTDLTHFNAAGGYRGGQVLADLLSPILPRINRLPQANPTQEPANITPNPMMAGTTGTKTGAGITGSVPTSWTVADLGTASTTVCSVQAADASDPDACPWLRVAVSAAGSAGIRVSAEDAAATGWAIADGFKYEFITEVRVTAGFSGSFIQPFLRMENSGGSFQMRTYDMFINNTPSWPGESSWLPHRQFVSRTFPAAIPATVIKMKGGVDIFGVGTVEIRRAAVRRYRNGV